MNNAVTKTGLIMAAGLSIGVLAAPQQVGAAVKSVQDVFVTNDASHPVPVAGAVGVAGTVGLDPAANAVHVDNAGEDPVAVRDAASQKAIVNGNQSQSG